ncbi:hypothetical protein GRI75_07580 [Altererythrobacter soli]|uniref:PilZ domain-containing protein n=1 Tax=Croceibacterium soli TaxID=1739690 RepID=A0A6I4UVH6_9SPHN|nr:hypothetical protein [Croceibacterium soli]
MPAVGTARPTIGTRVGRVENVSPAGAAICADIALDVGDSVPVKFHGREVIGARIAWKRGKLVGLAF